MLFAEQLDGKAGFQRFSKAFVSGQNAFVLAFIWGQPLALFDDHILKAFAHHQHFAQGFGPEQILKVNIDDKWRLLAGFDTVKGFGGLGGGGKYVQKLSSKKSQRLGPISPQTANTRRRKETVPPLFAGGQGSVQAAD